MNNIHDCKILNYQIDFENSKIEIIALSDHDKLVRILFEDFLAFHFENQIPNSILLDIVEGEIASFVLENKELLDKGKAYDWPMDYCHVDEIVHHIQKNSYQYYKIRSSYGLNGWVLSRNVTVDE